MDQETVKTMVAGMLAAGMDGAAIAAAIAAATAAPAPAAPAPAAPAPAVVAPTWVYAIRKLGADTSAAQECKKAAKYLKEQVLAGTFAPFEKTEEGKKAVLDGFFQHCKTQALWDDSRDGDSVAALGKSKSKREKAHSDAKAVYCAYVRILAMFRPAPVKKGLTLEKVFAAIDAAKKDSFPKVAADKWQSFKDFVEAEIIGA